MPQSARATFKLALAAVQSLLWRSVSMPQSARATFKRTRIPHDDGAEVWFQCLNRHEQPSSEEFEYLVSPSLDVSMPQSARATFKLRPLSPVDRRLDVSMPQSARATFKRTVSRSHSLMDDRVSMPQSARATFKLRIRCSA